MADILFDIFENFNRRQLAELELVNQCFHRINRKFVEKALYMPAFKTLFHVIIVFNIDMVAPKTKNK